MKTLTISGYGAAMLTLMLTLRTFTLYNAHELEKLEHTSPLKGSFLNRPQKTNILYPLPEHFSFLKTRPAALINPKVNELSFEFNPEQTVSFEHELSSDIDTNRVYDQLMPKLNHNEGILNHPINHQNTTEHHPISGEYIKSKAEVYSER